MCRIELPETNSLIRQRNLHNHSSPLIRYIDDWAKVVDLETALAQRAVKVYNPHCVRHRKTSGPFPVNTPRGLYRPVRVYE